MKRKSEILFLGLFFFLAGCGAKTEDSQDRIEHDVIEWEDIQGGADLESKTDESMTEAESQSETESATEQIISHVTVLYDFTEDIEKKHKILAYTICSEPKYDYENTPLADYINSYYIAADAELESKLKAIGEELVPKTTIDYHEFDFNDDGLTDYLICVTGAGWCGSGGNAVEIHIQEKDGSLKRVLTITAPTIESNEPNGHARFTVLDEKTDGYYAIVMPSSNRILRYDKETGYYEFHDGE